MPRAASEPSRGAAGRPVGQHPAGTARLEPASRARRPFSGDGRIVPAALPEIRALEALLDRDEAAGRDTSCLRQAIGELHWRLQYTGDAAAAAARPSTGCAPWPPGAAAERPPRRDEDGSFGVGTDVWFLKLDASVDRDARRRFRRRRRCRRAFSTASTIPTVSAPISTACVVSRLAEDGVDRRKELNFATADLVRLILRRRPPGYPWDPRLETVIRRFRRRLAGPDDRLFWRRLRHRRTALAHRRPQPDLSHGALSRRPDRPLAAADRHLARDPRRPLPQWLARRRRHDQPQQLRCRGAVQPRLAADAPRPAPARAAGTRSPAALVPRHRDRARTAPWWRARSANPCPRATISPSPFSTRSAFSIPAKRFWTEREFPEAPALRAAARAPDSRAAPGRSDGANGARPAAPLTGGFARARSVRMPP